MTIEEKNKLIQKGNEIYKRYDKRNIHLSQPFSIIDTEITKGIIDELNALDSQLVPEENPRVAEDLYLNELKRFCQGTSQLLNDEISPEIPTPEQIIARYNVLDSDVEYIKNWILENRE